VAAIIKSLAGAVIPFAAAAPYERPP
jgi:hypothetical protein